MGLGVWSIQINSNAVMIMIKMSQVTDTKFVVIQTWQLSQKQCNLHCWGNRMYLYTVHYALTFKEILLQGKV